MRKLRVGWRVFIVECADSTYFTGMCKDIKEKLGEIEARTGYYFKKHPERLPVKLVFEEHCLNFLEAYAKRQYLRKMHKKQKIRLIKTKRWPFGGPWRDLVERKNLIF